MPTFRLNENPENNNAFDLDGMKYDPESDFNEEQYDMYADIMKSQDLINKYSFEVHAVKAYQQIILDKLGASLKNG